MDVRRVHKTCDFIEGYEQNHRSSAQSLFVPGLIRMGRSEGLFAG